MKLIKNIVPILIAMVCVLAFSMPTAANPGLQVSNMILVTNASPGETLTFTMAVSIGAADPKVDIGVQVSGLIQALDGTNSPADESQDTSTYSARSFVTVDKNSFQLQPGGSQDVTATIQVPKDVGAGGRYAMIHITTLPVPGAGVSILTAVDVPVVLTISGSQIVHTGKISSLAVGQLVSGQPIDILTTFQNSGNHHFKIKNEVTVSDPQGKVLDTITTPLTFSSIVPTMSMQLKTTFTNKVELVPGVYTVLSKILADNGTVLDSANSNFTVGASGIAPVTSRTATTTAKAAPTVKTTAPVPGAPMASVPPVKPSINWAIIGGILAGVIVVGLVVFFIVRRKTQK
jgi:hypothetical protein